MLVFISHDTTTTNQPTDMNSTTSSQGLFWFLDWFAISFVRIRLEMRYKGEARLVDWLSSLDPKRFEIRVFQDDRFVDWMTDWLMKFNDYPGLPILSWCWIMFNVTKLTDNNNIDRQTTNKIDGPSFSLHNQQKYITRLLASSTIQSISHNHNQPQWFLLVPIPPPLLRFSSLHLPVMHSLSFPPRPPVSPVSPVSPAPQLLILQQQ